MDKDKLQQQVDEMKAKLAEMESLLNQPTINYWQPECKESYYYVNHARRVLKDSAHDLNLSRYRVFRTRDEAQHYADYIKAEETLRKAIAEANKGWMPDWNTHIEDKWCITIDAGLSELSETSYISLKHYPTFMYIKSGKLATYLMNTYRKEFITYLSY